jgi:hypothetical protein
MAGIDEIVKTLIKKPEPLSVAASRDGLPEAPGFYAWWSVAGSIPGVPRAPHPLEESLDLFYIGIAPSRSTSRATIRSRVLNNHIRGNTGSSTFRLTLASLLLKSENFQRTRSTDRVILSPRDNHRLVIGSDGTCD